MDAMIPAPPTAALARLPTLATVSIGSPQPQKRSPSHGRWQDALFRGTTRLFAALVLALLAWILVALGIAAAPALQKFGVGFFFTDVWNPVTQQFGALAPIYGTRGHVDDRARRRHSGQLRHRTLPDRAMPTGAEALARDRGGIARRHSVDHLRHVGPVRVRAVLRRSRAATADGHRRQVPADRPVVPGSADRTRRADRGHHPGGHGDSLHRVGHARCVRDRPAGAEGVRVRHRLHDAGRSSGTSCCRTRGSASSAASCSVSAARSARRWRSRS